MCQTVSGRIPVWPAARPCRWGRSAFSAWGATISPGCTRRTPANPTGSGWGLSQEVHLHLSLWRTRPARELRHEAGGQRRRPRRVSPDRNADAWPADLRAPPLLAARSEQWALCRSLTHSSNEHSAGHHIMLTGRSTLPVGFQPNAPSRSDSPSIAAIGSRALAELGLHSSTNLPPPRCFQNGWCTTAAASSPASMPARWGPHSTLG